MGFVTTRILAECVLLNERTNAVKASTDSPTMSTVFHPLFQIDEGSLLVKPHHVKLIPRFADVLHQMCNFMCNFYFISATALLSKGRAEAIHQSLEQKIHRDEYFICSLTGKSVLTHSDIRFCSFPHYFDVTPHIILTPNLKYDQFQPARNLTSSEPKSLP